MEKKTKGCNSIYLAYKHPVRFAAFIGSFIGCEVGSVGFVVKNKFYRISKGCVRSFETISRQYHYIPLAINDVDMFEIDCKRLIGKKWHILFSNCLTAFKEALNRQGIKINYWKFEFVPGIFLMKIIKNAACYFK